MFTRKSPHGAIRFALKPAQPASKVFLAADCNHWEPLSMKKQKDGFFVRNIDGPLETVEYKFIVDGQWITDPDNNQYAQNEFGTFNSVAPGDALGC